MGKFRYNIIENKGEDGSTAFIFDLRNSTEIIRKITWQKRLLIHIKFMMKLNEMVYKTLYENRNNDYFAMNDTGDGYLCVFWDHIHTITALRMAIKIKDYLDSVIPTHNSNLNLDKKTMFDYGFAFHTGKSTICRTRFSDDDNRVNKDFIFGIVANTASRLESLNKFYKEYKFLVTGNYKKFFKKHSPNNVIIELFNANNKLVSKSLGKVELRDGKAKGHYVYGLENEFFQNFKKLI